MSKHLLSVGLAAVILASLVGGAFAAPALADYVPYQGTLSCWPSSVSATSGQLVTFNAFYQNGYPYQYQQLTWSAVGGYPSSGTGTSFSTTFWSYSGTQTFTVTVTDGMQTATCTSTVTPTYTTPTPTPPYVGYLQCNPSQTWAMYGQDVTLNAWGSNGTYSWSAPEGNPSSGTGSSFTTRYYNTSGSTRTYTVTVSSYDSYYGTRTANCSVMVPTYTGYTPTPTPYYPYPTPYYPYTNGTLALSIGGRNLTQGQSSEYTSVSGRPGDTLDLILHVTAQNGPLSNVWVTDYLPAGVTYLPNTTVLNGSVAAEGVTSTGLYIGYLGAGQQATVKFSVMVQSGAVPTWGAVTVTDNAQSRADNAGTVAAAMSMVLGQQINVAQISSAVKTGPTDSLLYALAAAVLLTGMYAVYTRSTLFQKRASLAEINRLSKRSGLNFSR
ncbi:MAG TPA: hypothetical protein VMU12_01800 [Candidatus Paceibacterota bacterium]|nr:hypothetical protein [Candidatus Paceibacterota bacterium]